MTPNEVFIIPPFAEIRVINRTDGKFNENSHMTL